MGVFHRFLGPDPNAPQAAPPPAPAGEVPAAGSDAETATVRQIVARLEALPHEEARFLASFAYVMSRAANADLDISAEETAVMEQFVLQHGGLDEPQAILVVEMAKIQARSQGGTEDYVVTREFREISTPDQRKQLLRCCFAIEAADGTINAEEASIANEIARELDIEADDLNAIRDEFHEQLSSVQALRRAAGGTTA
ncbi:MAG TPA: TerB family tellurite resistance protein [Candidatus Limnocylindrales bacterium]|jgi:uncharacterized tellurite resistance protein B-like protein